MIAVEALFVVHVEGDEQATGHPHRQPGHVDEGVAFLPFKIAERKLQVVRQHDDFPAYRVQEKRGYGSDDLPPVPAPRRRHASGLGEVGVDLIEVAQRRVANVGMDDAGQEPRGG